MTPMTAITIQEMTEQATAEVLGLLFEDDQRTVIVDSPPGAGKTRLVETVASFACARGLKVTVVVPTNEQAFDLVRRLMDNFLANNVKLWLAHGRRLPDDLASRSDRRSLFLNEWGHAPCPDILVATVSKLGTGVVDFLVSEPSFDLLVCDEAYQVTFGDFMPLAHLARQYLLVGDPGQLRPTLNGVDLRRFEAALHKVHWPVSRELLRRNPSIPRVQLPVSRRLPHDTVKLVQPCFYPDMPFVAACDDQERRLTFAAKGMGGGAIDIALDRMTASDTIVGLILPESVIPTRDVDRDVVQTMAGVVERLLHRGAEWTGNRQLRARDIGCVDPHVVSNDALRQELAARGLPADEIMVEVPELWQGLERPVMVAKHPLTGQRRLTEFALESGRWCVSLSRHLLGCVIVGREGIGATLDRHQHDCAARAMGSDDTEWEGVLAHRRMWDELSQRGRLIAAQPV